MPSEQYKQWSVLTMNTLAFACNFAVWTMFSIIGIRIKDELGLSDTQFGILVATPILTGSLTRLPLGILTDLGSITPHVLDSFRSCHSLLLEFNHDLSMLHAGSYPPSLKRRVGGDWGHLNNDQAAQLLRAISLRTARVKSTSH